MYFNSHEIVDAFLEKNSAKLLEYEILPGIKQHEQHCIQTLRLYLEMTLSGDGYRLYPECEQKVWEALKKPLDDLPILILILGIAVLFRTNSTSNSEAGMFLNRLERLKTKNLPDNLHAWIHHIEWRHALMLGNWDAQCNALKSAFHWIGKPGSPIWLLLMNNRIESSLWRTDLKSAETDLAELEKFRHRTPFQGFAPYELMQIWYLQCSGRIPEALHNLENVPVEIGRHWKGLLLRIKIQTLLMANRFDEAEPLFSEARPLLVDTLPGTLFLRRYFTTLDFEHLHALRALRKGKLDEAYLHERQIASLALKGQPFGGERYSRNLLLNIEIVRGRSRNARLILQVMDPHAEWQKVEWAQLHMLEGNYDQAIQFFKQALENNGLRYLMSRINIPGQVTWNALGEILARVLDVSQTPQKKLTGIPPSPSQNPPSLPNTYLIGKSPAIQEVQARIQKFSKHHSVVLISGETGSGKEVVARMLHEMGSHAKEPFIPVNCGAMPDSLIESELFGYEKGAFTGAHASHHGLFISAGKGSIFLDEISSMSHQLQSALLRVLENEEVRPLGASKPIKMNARIIAATNEPLENLVEQKKFRKDLFYRLARLHIPIPPLRERKEDIPLLAHYFFQKLFGGLHYEISPELIDQLMKNNWPGNVRQLRNEIERLVLYFGESGNLTADHLEGKNPAQAPEIVIQPKKTVPTSENTPPISDSGPGYRAQRHQKIMEMLANKQQITRLEIINHLHCSPNTATQDLRALEERRLIQRIQPHSHPNSTYFVRG